MMARHYDHYSEIPAELWPWPNFAPAEIACKCCGAVMVNDVAMGRLQGLRERLQRPVRIASGYRSAAHNARVGGAPRSQHLVGRAFDIALDDAPDVTPGGLTADDLIAAARAAGFTGIGRYAGFVHVDIGPARRWDGRRS